MCLGKDIMKMFGGILFTIIKKSEAVQTSIKWQMNNQNVLYSCKGILFNLRKEQTTAIRYNMDKPQELWSEWKKPDAKDHIVYDSIYMKCPEKANL